jgi:hypothetical protein
VNHLHKSAKSRRTTYQPPDRARLSRRMACLRQVESRMDSLLHQVLTACSEQELSDAAERFDELILAYPTLRLTEPLERYPAEVWQLCSLLDLDLGPLPGFEAAMEQLCKLCLTPHAIDGLRSKLYTVAANVAKERPEWLPTVAIAALSLFSSPPAQSAFVDMVICASAIEWLTSYERYGDRRTSLDVGAWLAAEPSEWLMAAVGEERAYYYASIPGVLPFLDQRHVLFDARRLLSCTQTPSGPKAGHDLRLLGNLADRCYQRCLRDEIERTQNVLRKQHSATSIADVEMLAHRALEALDDLPPQVNPLLQAIWVQSWVHCLQELCG